MITRPTFTLFFVFALQPTSGWTQDYVYPAKVEPDISCHLDADTLASIEKRYSYDETPRGLATAESVDLNADGVCEVYLDTPTVYEGNGNEKTRILLLDDGEYRNAPPLPWNYRQWWYGESRNGYLRIFVSEYTGHRTNPTYVTDVYYYDGDAYVKEFDSGSSHGYYMDLGIEAYQRQDYSTAEKHYLSAFRMWKENELDDANNLALTWAKLGRFDEAERLLLEQIAARPEKKQQRYRNNNDLAAAYFNLGLISEKRGDLSKALGYFKWSHGASPNAARSKKLEDVKKRLGVTDGPLKCVNESGDVSYTDNKSECQNPVEVTIQRGPEKRPVERLPTQEETTAIHGEAIVAGARRRGKVNIDGVMSRGEWRGVEPQIFALGESRKSELDLSVYIMNDDDSLYIAVTYQLPTAAKAASTVFVQFDQRFLGNLYEGQDSLGLSPYSQGGFAYYDQVRTSRNPCTSNGLCGFHDTDVQGTIDGKGAYRVAKDVVTYEFMKPLRSRDRENDMQVNIGDSLGISGTLQIQFGANHIESYYFPGPSYLDLFSVKIVGR